MIRTINNVIRTLLFQAHLPPTFWVEALHMAAYLLNLLPSTAINNEIPFTRLFNQTPDYSNLRIFGCLWLCRPPVASPRLPSAKVFILSELAPRAWFQRFAGLFLSQKKYAIELLAHAHMTDYNPSRTLVDTNSKLCPKVVPVQDPTLYRSLAGGLQYLTFTRRDISYAVRQICLYIHDPRKPHHDVLKRILRYIQGTLDFGFHLYSSTTISLVGYTDADWAGCPSTRRSTSAETAWLHNLLRELHSPLSAATLVYYDNVSATYLSANPIQHQQTKHIEIDIHFIFDLVIAGQV
nr:ribonuclease H-like domain-containing protein [Tanacetum cinerariifolium]